MKNPTARIEWKKLVGAVAGIAAALLLWFIPLNLASQTQHALAIAAFMIIFWCVEPIDHALTGLIGCYLFWALRITNFTTAFSGFAEDTPWFLLGAILLGAMAVKSGLAQRLAYVVMSRVGTTYSRILLGLIIVDFLLTFLVPSGIAKVIILAAIASGIVSTLSPAPKSNVGRGLFVILTYTATIFDKMIIAGVSAIVARGLIEKIGNVPVYWSQWFFAYLPCDVVTILACWLIVRWLYPAEEALIPLKPTYLKEQLDKLGKWTPAEKKSAALMLIAIALWLTDFLHHIKPSVIGLGAGLAACLPRIGVLDTEDLKKVNLLPVFLVGAVISLSTILETSKALDVLNAIFFSWLDRVVTGAFQSAVILYWTGFVYHFILPEPSMISTSMPILMRFALNNGLNPLAIGMIWTFAAGGKIFIYQSPVLVVGYSYGYFEAKDLLKVGALLTIVESIILLFLVPLYWPLIGIR
jgi:anion transporter